MIENRGEAFSFLPDFVGHILSLEAELVRLAREALGILLGIVERLSGHTVGAIPDASRREEDISALRAYLEGPSAPPTTGGHARVTVGQALLDVMLPSPAAPLPPTAFPTLRWNVVLGAKILVSQPQPNHQWSANLSYADVGKADGFRWREVSYFPGHRQEKFEPFALKRVRDADKAGVGARRTYMMASGPEPIDDECEVSFIERWGALLAKAVQGQLRRPAPFGRR